MLLAFVLYVFITQALLCSSQTQLAIPSVTQQEVTTGKPPVALVIPQTAAKVNLSVAICSSDEPFPSLFIFNGTGPADPPENQAGMELTIDGGVASWEGEGPATLYAFPPAGVSGSRFFEVALSQGDATFGTSLVPPFFGDSTSTQLLVFSPPYDAAPSNEPSYPNYVLPLANLSSPQPVPRPPTLNLFVYKTSNISTLAGRLGSSFCAMAGFPGDQVSAGHPLTTTLVLRDSQGWRTQWILEGLAPSTNYTVFVAQNQALISPPLYFTTKSAAFSCSLVHSLPYCPAVTYSVPLPPPKSPQTSYIPNNLPESISSPLLSSLGNFTTSLLTFACGRDVYSPVQTCANCQSAYAEWLCAVSFPRCTESNPSLEPAAATMSYAANQTSRSQNIAPLKKPFVELLPCLETCHAVARACPSFLGWQCPIYDVNANSSYGVGFIDGHHEEGVGNPGYAQDEFGNVWCNLP